MKRDLSHVPPIGDRPKCKGCGRRLRPVSYAEYERIERPKTEQEIESEAMSLGGPYARERVSSVALRHKMIGRKFNHWQGYDGFHSLRCALDFARAAYLAGFRRTKP